MALPVRTTVEDIVRICQYLATKPTGATPAEAKRVLDPHLLDRRKLSALKTWGFIEELDGRLKVNEVGRAVARDIGNGLPRALKEVISRSEPYNSVIERAAHLNEESLSAVDVAAYWHTHFSDEVAGSDDVLNEQAVCFFQIVHGAQLGNLIIGRKGSPTRIDFNRSEITAFVGSTEGFSPPAESGLASNSFESTNATASEPPPLGEPKSLTSANLQERGIHRVFITHGRNSKIVEQLKEIVTFGKLIPVVAQEHETTSKPVPQKVMEDMRSCDAAIIHVAGDETVIEEDEKPHRRINENVLIEIGAAMALYNHNFILLVEKGVNLPSNLQGLYECRYEGDKLDGESTMKLLKAFNEFNR